MPTTSLRVHTAFVAASTGGLGLACAEALAADGVRVAITGRRGDVARALALKIPGSLAVEADLTDEQAMTTAVETVLSEFRHVDILVLNSGGPPPGSVLGMGVDELRRAMELIVYPGQRLICRLVPEMIHRGWGRVVAIGSSGVEQPIAGLAASNAARASQAALLKTLAGEVAASGVTVNMVLPGRFDTERVRALDAQRAADRGDAPDDVARSSQAAIPAGRYGHPGELAAAVAFLSSERASYITGGLLRVDGGLIASTT